MRPSTGQFREVWEAETGPRQAVLRASDRACHRAAHTPGAFVPAWRPRPTRHSRRPATSEAQGRWAVASARRGRGRCTDSAHQLPPASGRLGKPHPLLQHQTPQEVGGTERLPQAVALSCPSQGVEPRGLDRLSPPRVVGSAHPGHVFERPGGALPPRIDHDARPRPTHVHTDRARRGVRRLPEPACLETKRRVTGAESLDPYRHQRIVVGVELEVPVGAQ